jgi:hypothetical protein
LLQTGQNLSLGLFRFVDNAPFKLFPPRPN